MPKQNKKRRAAAANLVGAVAANREKKLEKQPQEAALAARSKTEEPATPRWTAIFLAAGHNEESRFHRSIIEGDTKKQFQNLLALPKLLTPLVGVPVVEHWLRQLAQCGIDEWCIVTNETHASHFRQSSVFFQMAQGIIRSALEQQETFIWLWSTCGTSS